MSVFFAALLGSIVGTGLGFLMTVVLAYVMDV